MIGRKIFASEFPQSGVEITHVNDVPGGVFDLDTIADLVRPSDQDVDPAEETGHRRLHSQANDDGADTDGNERSVTINENNTNNDDSDDQSDEQMFDPAKSEASGRVIEPPDRINGNGFGNREHDDNEHRAAKKSPGEINSVRGYRKQLRADEIIKDSATHDQKGVGNKPELIFRCGLNFFLARLGAGGLGKGLPNLGFLGNFLSCLSRCHLL